VDLEVRNVIAKWTRGSGSGSGSAAAAIQVVQSPYVGHQTTWTAPKDGPQHHKDYNSTTTAS
jgi:hypothetical protein